VSQIDQLLIPDAAKNDAASFELIRIWVADNEQHISLRLGVWEDPAAWGIMLADLAKHIANSYEQDAALDKLNVFQRIKSTFEIEMSAAVDKLR